jgi:hypothetical protein
MSGCDPAVPDEHVILKHPRGVAPERVPRADATDGSVRDLRAL